MRSPPTRELTELALSLMGLWFAAQALVTAANYLALLTIPDLQSWPWPQFLPLAVYLVAAVFLLVFRRRLAVELFPGAVDRKPPSTDDPESLRDFSIALLGLWIFSIGLSAAASIESQLVFQPRASEFDGLFHENRPSSMISREAWLARAPYLTELVFGLFLFVYSGRVGRLWASLRRAGRRHSAGA